jgi:O-antigen ligase
MFWLPAIVLTLALMSFGGVLPHSSFLLFLAWFVGATLVTSLEIIRKDRLRIFLIAVPVVTLLTTIWLGPKIGLWAAGGLWGWVAAQDNENGVLRFFKFLLLIGILEATLGLVQYLVAPGWILGYQNSSGTGVSGTLVNRNHFAGLLEMLIPVTLGLGYIAARRYRDFARPYVYVLCGAFISLAVVFSLSRMGIFTLLSGLLGTSLLIWFRSAQHRLALGFGLGVAGLLASAVLWIGVDTIVSRYGEMLSENVAVQDGRLVVFRDTIKLLKAFPGGVGTGRYQDVFRQYQTTHLDYLFDHAHNDYLETAAEWGIVVATLFWALIGAVFAYAIRTFAQPDGSDEEKGILVACIAAIFSILLHSFADFNLQIPSNAYLFFTFVGIALGTSLSRTRLNLSRRV